MRDQNLTLLLVITFAIFAVIALFAVKLFDRFTRAARIKRPHRHLVLIFRLWFGVLALATLVVLISQFVRR